MFSDKKSKYLIIPFFVLFVIFIVIIISNFTFKTKESYKTINKSEEIKIGNRTLILTNINRSNEHIYIELVEEDWITNDNLFNFKATFKNDSENEVKNFIKLKYKGYYLLKIPAKNGFEVIKLIIDYDKANYFVYFEEKNINSGYEEIDIAKYKEHYLMYSVQLNDKKIMEKQEQIFEKNKELNKKESELEEIKGQIEFQVGDELDKSKSKLQSIDAIMENIKGEILNLDNEIITLQNKNLMLDAEIFFVKTGEKKDVVLISHKDKDGNKIDDKVAKEYSKKEEEKEKEEKKKLEEKLKNNENNSNNNSQKNTKNYNVNSQKKTNEKVENTTQNNVKNNEVESKNNQNNSDEIEIEFVP